MERAVTKEYEVYLLSCADGTLYCGIAKNAQERAKVHNTGKGAKYTRSRLPVIVAYTERAESKSAALKREAEIKKLTKQQKLSLIESLGN